jgi:hypothetical protein
MKAPGITSNKIKTHIIFSALALGTLILVLSLTLTSILGASGFLTSVYLAKSTYL